MTAVVQKDRILFGDHSPVISFPHKGKLMANEKSFYGDHSASKRDISILLQWSCVVQFRSFIPRNLAIKDKVCSTFYTGHYSTSFHMKTKNGYFCYYLYDFCFYDINLHWSSTFSFFGGCGLLGGPRFTNLGTCIILNWVTTMYPLSPMGKGWCSFSTQMNYFLSKCLPVI